MDEYTQLREANPAFDPVRPVITVNVRPAERDTGVPLVTDPLTRQVMDLFNVSYEVLLLALQRFFAHTEETDAQLKALADATVALMFGAIKPLGDLVTTLPAGPDYPARTAGPSFELFYESDYVLPHREAAWILLTQRIRQAARFCEPDAPCPAGISDGLTTVQASLIEIARSLEAHMPAGDVWTEPPAPAQTVADLLARAGDFYRTGHPFTGPAPTCPGRPARPASTTRSAAAVTRRTSRSAAACTGTSISATRYAGPAPSRPCSNGPAACPH